jgi:hypothetical protein
MFAPPRGQDDAYGVPPSPERNFKGVSILK